MDDRLKNGLNALINRHHSAVQCDTELSNASLTDDNYQRLTKTSKRFWETYEEELKRFKALLEEYQPKEKVDG